jgi:hypothetical protein
LSVSLLPFVVANDDFLWDEVDEGMKFHLMKKLPAMGIFTGVLLCISAEAQTGPAPVLIPYTAMTVAGNPQAPIASLYTGTKTGAIGTALNGPVGMAVDSSYNLYIADGNSNIVREVTAASGIISTLAGTTPVPGCGGTSCTSSSSDTGNAGPAVSANLSLPTPAANPNQVTLDSYGNIYFPEASHEIKVIYEGGATLQAFLQTIYPSSTITAGNIYTLAGGAGYTWKDGTALVAQFHSPIGIAVDASGNVYIADNRNYAIRVLNTQTTAITVWGTTIQPGYVGTVVGMSCVVGSTCASGSTTNNTAANASIIDQPQDIWLDSYGDLFIATWYNGGTNSYKTITVIYNGGTGNPLTSLITLLHGSAPTAGYSYLLAGAGSKAINTISSYGSLGTAVYLQKPIGVIPDANGNIYFADSGYNTVYRLDAVTGEVSIIAGGGTYHSTTSSSSPAYCVGTSGTQTTTPDEDGCVTSAINLNTPFGLTLDASGNLYIVDSLNNAIREVLLGSSFSKTDVGASLTQKLLLHFYASNLPASSNPFSLTSSQFTLTGTPSCTVNTDGSEDCILSVTFAPTAAVVSTANLVATDIHGNANNIVLTGTGTTSATTTTLTVTPYAMVPGNTPTFSARVTGGTTVPTGTVTFYLNGNATATVALNASGIASYTNPPIQVGISSASATYNGAGGYAASNSNTQVITVASSNGLNINWPFVNWAQTVAQGAKSPTWPIFVTNNSGTTLSSITVSGTSGLSIGSNTCSVGLLWGSTCSFTVQLAPTTSTATGAYSGSITATSGSYSASIPVTGSVSGALFYFNWPFLNWALPQIVGTSTALWPVTLTNSTGTTFNSSSPIAISVPAGFTVSSNTCATATVNPGGTCTFNVQFTPVANGVATGSLTATGAGVSSSIPVTGNGMSPYLNLNWPYLGFGNQSIGTSSPPWPVTVTNLSSTTINGMTVSIPNANFTSDLGSGVSSCTGILQPYASCLFNVYFSPVGTVGTQVSTTVTISGSGVSGSLPATGYIQAASGSAAGMVGFASTSYAVNEDSGTATLSVNRTGGSTGAITVSYTTNDGTAVSTYDYRPTSGILSWASGDATPKTITVPINDNHVTGSGTVSFNVELLNQTGGSQLGTNAASVVTITDNDAAVPTFFVNAGSAIDIWSDNPTATLSGSASGTNGTVSYQWFMNAGPGTVIFGTPTAATTTASFSQSGYYDIGFTVTDSTGSKTDYVTVSYFGATEEMGTSAETFTNFNYTQSQLDSWFRVAVPLTYDYTNISNTNLKQPPAPYVHPRILINPEDLPAMRTRLSTTPAGEAAMNLIRSVVSTNLTGLNATYSQIYSDLQAGNMNSFVALTNQIEVYGLLADEAFRCVVDQDNISGQKVAAAISTVAIWQYAAIKAANSQDWRNVNSITLMYSMTGYAYDFAYNFMTPAQQATVRQALTAGTTNQWSIGMDTLPGYHASSSNWINNNTAYLAIDALAVEGEAGSDPYIIPRVRADMDKNAYFAFGPNGAYFEGMGKGQIDADMHIAMAKRNHMLIASTRIKNHIKEFYLNTMEPWGEGWMWDELLGGEEEGSKLADVPALKWAFPTDPNIDLMYRTDYLCQSGNSSYCQGGNLLTTVDMEYSLNAMVPIVRATLAQNWNSTSETWAQAETALNGVEPNYYFDSLRGIAVFRDQWAPSAVRLVFQPRSEPGGHSIPDRNNIVFDAFSRLWIPLWVNEGNIAPNPSWTAADEGLGASTMQIDGYTVSTFPSRVVDVNTGNSLYSYMTGDATLPFNWQAPTTGGTTYQTWTYAQTLYTNDGLPYTTIPMWEQPDWQFSNEDVNGSTPSNSSQFQIANFPNSAIQYAFRTAGLVRGSDPFAVISDDVKIDGKSHNYVFRLMLQNDLTVSTLDANDAVLTDPATGNRVLVHVVTSSAAVSFVQSQIPNGVFAAPASSWSYLPTLDIDFTTTTNPANIKVILIPVASGVAVPTFSYSSNVLTVTTSDGVVSTVNFASAADGHTTFSTTQVVPGGASMRVPIGRTTVVPIEASVPSESTTGIRPRTE